MLLAVMSIMLKLFVTRCCLRFGSGILRAAYGFAGRYHFAGCGGAAFRFSSCRAAMIFVIICGIFCFNI